MKPGGAATFLLAQATARCLPSGLNETVKTHCAKRSAFTSALVATSHTFNSPSQCSAVWLPVCFEPATRYLPSGEKVRHCTTPLCGRSTTLKRPSSPRMAGVRATAGGCSCRSNRKAAAAMAATKPRLPSRDNGSSLLLDTVPPRHTLRVRMDSRRFALEEEDVAAHRVVLLAPQAAEEVRAHRERARVRRQGTGRKFDLQTWVVEHGDELPRLEIL